MLIRLDRAGASARLGATPIEVTPEGFKVYRGTAAYGDVVYEYPEKGRNEYVPAAEALAPDIVSTIVGKPFTIHHPDDLLTADAPDDLREHVEGTVRAARANLEKSPPELEVEVVVWTRPAQEEIESGAVVELSPGYFCEEDDAPADAVGPGGKPFSKVQRRRQYNHLSGVMRARGVTPDGRRARLDGAAWLGRAMDLVPSEAVALADSIADLGDQLAEMDRQTGRIITGHAVALDAAPPDGVYLADWDGPFVTYHHQTTQSDPLGLLHDAVLDIRPIVARPAKARRAAAYPHTDATEYDMEPTLADAASPIPPADALPGAAAPDMDPAQALAVFSPEAAEILKSLPPDDLALLVQMAVVREAEAAEHAVEAEAEAAGIPLVDPAEGVEAGTDQPEIEIEVEPASEGEEETEGAEGGAALPESDATVPMAAQGLTDAPAPPAASASAPVTQSDLAAAIDTLGNKMIEMMNAAMAASAKAAKTDAAPSLAASMQAPGADPKVAREAAQTLAAKIDAARVADEAAFLAAVKNAGHRVDSYPEAALKAVAVVKDHASPALAGLAAAAAKEGRRADLLALFEDAEARRRDALLGEQFNSLRLVIDAEDDYRQQRTDGVGGSSNADAPLPAYLPIPGAARAGK